jgi:hypothetical protein
MQFIGFSARFPMKTSNHRWIWFEVQSGRELKSTAGEEKKLSTEIKLTRCLSWAGEYLYMKTGSPLPA